MNPQSPREELEIRITALLMGELSPDEAAALQVQIAADAELTALHTRLQRAMGLLREASAIPQQPAAREPAHLSEDRGARLLAHFKGAKPGPVIVKTRRDWKWAVPLGLAASLMALIGGAMYVNGFGLRKGSTAANAALFFDTDRDGSANLGTWGEPNGKSGEKRNGYAATDQEGGRGKWGSLPETIRGVPSQDGERGSGDAHAFYRQYAFQEGTAEQAAETDPAFIAGSAWDTPRVQTHFDRGVSGGGSGPAFRGGLATAQTQANAYGRQLSDTSTRAASGNNLVYLPAAAEAPGASLANGKLAAGEERHPAVDPSVAVASSSSPLQIEGAAVPMARELADREERAASNPTRRLGVERDEKGASRPVATPAPSSDLALGKRVEGEGKGGRNAFTDGRTSGPGDLRPDGAMPADGTPALGVASTPTGGVAISDDRMRVQFGTTKPPGVKVETPPPDAAILGDVLLAGTSASPAPDAKPGAPSSDAFERGVKEEERVTTENVDKARHFATATNRLPELNLSDRPRESAFPTPAKKSEERIATRESGTELKKLAGIETERSRPAGSSQGHPGKPATTSLGLVSGSSAARPDDLPPRKAGSGGEAAHGDFDKDLGDFPDGAFAGKADEGRADRWKEQTAAASVEASKKRDSSESALGVMNEKRGRAEIAAREVAPTVPAITARPPTPEPPKATKPEMELDELKRTEANPVPTTPGGQRESFAPNGAGGRQDQPALFTDLNAFAVLPKGGTELATNGDGIAGSGAATLSKTGGGTWQMSGAKTYAGTTSVSGGNLVLNGGGTLNFDTGIGSVTNGTSVLGVDSPIAEPTPEATMLARRLDSNGRNGKDDSKTKNEGSEREESDQLRVETAKLADLKAKLSGAAMNLEQTQKGAERDKDVALQAGEPKEPRASGKLKEMEQVESLDKKIDEALLEKSKVMELKKEIQEAKESEPAPPKPAPSPLVPQPEVRTGENAFSTFSLNVSDVAFKLAAASLERGVMPDVSTLRTEEFINAFDYRDPEPAPGAPLAFASERARYPFAQNRDVIRFSVKTAAVGRQQGKPLNVVLLLDNSGSMERADRVRIVREAMRSLSAQLTPLDKLSIVTFSRTPRLWADGVAGDKAGEVTARVGEITPEGGTNLGAALDLGYKTALRHYQPGSINHVVMLTDGAANLGDVDPAALKQKVETHRKQGIALDCFGVGWEGLNDDMLEQLSRNGDGRYGFINSPEEAATNFSAQLAGALHVAAADVKVQVEWNPKRVTAYRQVGYAKHQLTKEQFRDNTVDAAELAAAESGNALYVVEVNPRGEGDLGIVRVRFKVPGTSDYREHEWAVPFTRAAAPLEQSSSSLRLAATAAAFSEMLAGSPFATEVTSDRLLGLLNGVPAICGADPRPTKLEWMIRQAKSLSGR